MHQQFLAIVFVFLVVEVSFIRFCDFHGIDKVHSISMYVYVIGQWLLPWKLEVEARVADWLGSFVLRALLITSTVNNLTCCMFVDQTGFDSKVS